MTKLRTFLARLCKDESGATMVEYSVLIGIITAITIGIIVGVGGFVDAAWTDLCDNLALTDLGCTPAGGGAPAP